MFDIARDLAEPEQMFLLGSKRRSTEDDSDDSDDSDNDDDDDDDNDTGSNSDSDTVNGEKTETDSELADQEARVLSFTIGSPPTSTIPSDCGWEAFTLYYALPDGFVYSICPVLPHDR